MSVIYVILISQGYFFIFFSYFCSLWWFGGFEVEALYSVFGVVVFS